MGYVDDEGYLFLTDRKHFMIISGGVNIYPQEAENVLIMHDTVVDVAVIGIPNEEFGEEVKAVVQPKDMAEAGPELEIALMDYLPFSTFPYQMSPFDRLSPSSSNGKTLQTVAEG